MESFHNYIDNSLDDLDRRMDECIKRYDLSHPQEDLFKGYTPISLGEIVAHVQTLFTRCDMMLRVYNCQLKWMADEFHLDALSEETQRRHRELRHACHDMRVIYIDHIGSNVMVAFRRLLLTQSHAQPIERKEKGMELNELLVHYFGDCMIDSKNFDEPVVQELFNLLRDVGKLTGHVTAAETLVETIQTLSL